MIKCRVKTLCVNKVSSLEESGSEEGEKMKAIWTGKEIMAPEVSAVPKSDFSRARFVLTLHTQSPGIHLNADQTR